MLQMLPQIGSSSSNRPNSNSNQPERLQSQKLDPPKVLFELPTNAMQHRTGILIVSAVWQGRVQACCMVGDTPRRS